MLITRLLNKLVQDVQQTKKSYYTQVERACNSALRKFGLLESDTNIKYENFISYMPIY